MPSNFSLLNDKEILYLCEQGMISPFVSVQIRELYKAPVVSFGMGHFGYDIRLDSDFLVPGEGSWIFDPHHSEQEVYDAVRTNRFLLWPGQMVLGRSLEAFQMPADVLAICLGKSTYARKGLCVNVTPLEPGWRGVLTMELSNIGSKPIALYAHEGIAQLLFFRGEQPEVTYAGRPSAYQNQAGIAIGQV